MAKSRLFLYCACAFLILFLGWLTFRDFGSNDMPDKIDDISILSIIIYLVLFGAISSHFTYFPKFEDEKVERKIYPLETRLRWYKINIIILSVIPIAFLIEQLIVSRLYHREIDWFQIIFYTVIIAVGLWGNMNDKNNMLERSYFK